MTLLLNEREVREQVMVAGLPTGATSKGTIEISCAKNP